jgi:hypothetical protein
MDTGVITATEKVDENEIVQSGKNSIDDGNGTPSTLEPLDELPASKRPSGWRLHVLTAGYD